MKSYNYATWTLLSILLSSVSGQGTTISSLPQCGQNCFNVIFNEFGRACPQADASCFCAQPGFVPEITSCTSQQCVAATDANITLTFAQLYCSSASSNTSIGTIIPTTTFSVNDPLTLNGTTIDVSTLPHTIISISAPGPFTNLSTASPSETGSDSGIAISTSVNPGPSTSVIQVTPTITATPTAPTPSPSPGFNAGIKINSGVGFASLVSVFALSLANLLFA